MTSRSAPPKTAPQERRRSLETTPRIDDVNKSIGSISTAGKAGRWPGGPKQGGWAYVQGAGQAQRCPMRRPTEPAFHRLKYLAVPYPHQSAPPSYPDTTSRGGVLAMVRRHVRLTSHCIFGVQAQPRVHHGMKLFHPLSLPLSIHPHIQNAQANRER